MDEKLQKEVRALKAYMLGATLLVGLLIFVAFRKGNAKTKFTEIDVERINILSRDGKLRMVISNEERLPEAIMNGKTFARQGRKSPGMIFYNHKGDECGGLVFGSQEKDGKFEAGAALLFDQYNQDQTVGIMYDDANGSRLVGLNIWDRPDIPYQEMAEKLEAVRKMKEGPKKTEAFQNLIRTAEVRRLFVGKESDKSASILLSDPKGQPRIRITVDAAGFPKLDFLDESGKLVYSLPPSARVEQGTRR